MSDRFYITTPIYYVNDMPHIGHIYTTVMADILARYQRLRGKQVYFLTGTDEHGQKIEKAARSQGITPLDLADRVVARYQQLWKVLDISHDDFIRTTEVRHQRGVAEIIRRITAAGDIYAGKYTGWYCAGAEAFVPDSQVVDGRDTESGYPVELLSEPSYFFRLSAYQQRLLEWYRANPECILPRSRYNEVVRFVEGGLKDLSISRCSLRWGVPFPNDPEHVVYVWLDALTNYVSALGFGTDSDELFQTYWPAQVHLVGKDILRFHCVYWPAFLMSAGVEPPHQVFGHGWWLRDEAKMSKSLGNVVRPDHLISRFGADALRYFLARDMAFGQDASFSDESFLERFNSDLANALGNTLSRTTAMTSRYCGGLVPASGADDTIPEAARQAVASACAAMDRFEPHRALESTWHLLSVLDGFIQERQPWQMAKLGDSARRELEGTLYACLEGLRVVSLLVEPFIPTTAAKLRAQIGAAGLPLDLIDATRWGTLPAGAQLAAAEPLFPRVDIESYAKETASTGAAVDATQTAELDSARPNQEQVMISIEEFANVKLVVGIVRHAELVPKTSKLLRLEVDLGEAEPRQLVAGIAERYPAQELVGRRIVVVANLQPATIRGVESRGMLLAASVDGVPYLLAPDSDVPAGTQIK